MLLLKACPKCGGDMHLDGDMYGSYASCLNCGYLRDIPIPEKEEKAAAVVGPRAQKRAA